MVPFVPLCCFHTHAVICICIEFMIFPFVLYCSSTSSNLVYTLHSTAHSVSRMFLLRMWRIRHLDSFAIPSGSSNCRLTLATSLEVLLLMLLILVVAYLQRSKKGLRVRPRTPEVPFSIPGPRLIALRDSLRSIPLLRCKVANLPLRKKMSACFVRSLHATRPFHGHAS